MAHPKSKISKARRDKRRTHKKARHYQTAKCPNCGATVQAHRVCGECGHYRGQMAIDTGELDI